ncbi:MAG: glucosamine-6-phosphate deaminase [Candidatus Omnitrophota bacterium]|jgi:glucosamine-6-phosphate deaminase|nr:MAG: glucosamine-6-phosphate deaminase [Candidatus Omnitrophota bacterium]
MEVIIKKDYEAMSKEAALIVANLVKNIPNCVLGLATGSTPIGLYKELIRMHKNEGLDFSKVTTFNLDEYCGLPPSHDQSYHYFMHDNLFNHINVQPQNIHVPSGTAPDVDAFCEWYEDEIEKAGGIDLQVLGIGGDGHIAFNEPGSSLGSRTRMKTLTQETIDDNARFFAKKEDVPRYAITMGVGTIMEAGHCLLLCNGEKKAETIARAIEGPITAEITASALQMHPQATFILDEPAATKLKRYDYYKWVYDNKP